jgi:hypothetical protein
MHVVLTVWASLFSNDTKWGTINISRDRMHQRVASPSLFRVLFCFWRHSPQWARASSFTSFLDHTQRSTTVCRTPLDEWSARRRDLYLTTYNTHNRQISRPLVGFEPTISAGERPQTYAFDGVVTWIGHSWYIQKENSTLYVGWDSLYLSTVNVFERLQNTS